MINVFNQLGFEVFHAVIISGALHLAVLDEIIPYNIAKDGSIKVPKAKRYHGEVYDKAEAQELLKVANEEQYNYLGIML